MAIRIFYLDDEVDLCEVFKDNFQTAEIDISVFSDPAQAIAAVVASPPDLFFVDFRLPGMTGEDVAKRVGPSVPVILLSGDIDVTTSDIFHKKLPKQPYPFQEIEAIIADAAERNAA